jgi:peptide/nickel transport system substrate-binding protein
MADEPSDQLPINQPDSFETPDSVDSTPTPVEPASPPQPVVSQGSSHKLRNIILILVLIVAATSGYLLATHKKSSSTQTSSATTKHDVSLLRYGVDNFGNVPDYPINTIGSAFSVEINAQLFEGLVGYQNLSKVVPLLATSWYNPDSSTWVFNLRHNIKFHSGRTMTAADVKYTFDYAIAHQNDDNGTSVLGLASTFQDVTVVNPYQVKIVTKGPDPILLSKLSALGILDSKAKLGDYTAGTGPYTPKPGTTPTDTAIDLVASNNYWGGHIYTREVDVSTYSDPTKQFNDTKSGKLGLAGEFNTDQIAQLKPTRQLSVTDDGTDFIGFNTNDKSSPVSNKAAREAVADALNIPAILKAAKFNGFQASQLVPLQLSGYNPAISPTKYDPAKAKQLLSTVPNGTQPITFTYLHTNVTGSQEIIKELEAVGFNIKPQPIDSLDTLANNAISGKYDMFSYGYTSSFQDGEDILSGLLQNNQAYSNPQIDDLLSKAGNTLDQKARIQDMQKVATIVNQDMPYVPLYIVNRQYAIEKPYVIKSDMPGMVTGVYFWKVYQ